MSSHIYFWQRSVSPHMAYLADAIAGIGIPVTYVANSSISSLRKQMGWDSPALKYAKLLTKADYKSVKDLVYSVPSDSIHLCQGIRANQLIGFAQTELSKRGLTQLAIMETIDDRGIIGFIRRYWYRNLIQSKVKSLHGILAIGFKTKDWLVARGFPRHKIYPFAYFLSDEISQVKSNLPSHSVTSPFQFIFVGQLIHRKCIDQLLYALSLCRLKNFELTIIGDGPLRCLLESFSSFLLPGKVKWLGKMKIAEIPQKIADSDCLVLPSRHDGWGAVIVEALMVGTPVVCSDACGAAGVVSASGLGGVFLSNNVQELSSLLNRMIALGSPSISDRIALKQWSKFLAASQGAQYIKHLLFSSTPDSQFNLIPSVSNNKSDRLF